MLDNSSTLCLCYIECASCVKVQNYSFCAQHDVVPLDLELHVNSFDHGLGRFWLCKCYQYLDCKVDIETKGRYCMVQPQGMRLGTGRKATCIFWMSRSQVVETRNVEEERHGMCITSIH
jgi:hypothetical protein